MQTVNTQQRVVITPIYYKGRFRTQRTRCSRTQILLQKQNNVINIIMCLNCICTLSCCISDIFVPPSSQVHLPNVLNPASVIKGEKRVTTEGNRVLDIRMKTNSLYLFVDNLIICSVRHGGSLFYISTNRFGTSSCSKFMP